MLRGELSYELGKWGDAKAAFQSALGATQSPALVERALYGLAATRLQLGDEAGGGGRCRVGLKVRLAGASSMSAECRHHAAIPHSLPSAENFIPAKSSLRTCGSASYLS